MLEQTRVHLRLGKSGSQPVYATAGSAGCDLIAAVPLVLRPGECRVLPLDLVMAIEPGVEAQIRPRSGLSLRMELRVPNSPGTIDSDYRQEVGVILQNTFSLSHLAEQILISPQLAIDLAARCRRVPLADYLRQGDQTADGAAARAAAVLENQLPEIGRQMIYLDEQGNPWGTLYIRPGDRIAQMVFARYLQGCFIEHPEPENIGQNRGGGFGSTGG